MSTNDRTLAEGLIEVSDMLQRKLRRSYHESGLTPARLSALSYIVDQGIATGGKLAQAEQVTAATMTRIVDALEESGHITRTPSTIDRRIIELRPTEKGLTAAKEGRDWQIQTLSAELLSLGSAQVKTLQAATEVLRKLDL